MISVVIPLYNKEKSITDTISSVLRQTYENFELIVVDDGSNDSSLEVIQKMKDNRLIIINKKNGGVSSARNEGIKMAKYDYIAFLDGYDIWKEDHLETMIELISKYNQTDIVGFATCFIKISNRSDMIGFHSDKKDSYVIEDYYLANSTPYELLSSSSFMIKKDGTQNKYYDTNYSYGEDVEFWYRIFRNKKIAISNKITAFYILEAENRSNHKATPLKKRFSEFYFEGKSESEKKYLGKLVALLLIDYTLHKEFKIVYNVWNKYKNYKKYIFRYLKLLILKKLK